MMGWTRLLLLATLLTPAAAQPLQVLAVRDQPLDATAPCTLITIWNPRTQDVEVSAKIQTQINSQSLPATLDLPKDSACPAASGVTPLASVRLPAGEATVVRIHTSPPADTTTDFKGQLLLTAAGDGIVATEPLAFKGKPDLRGIWTYLIDPAVPAALLILVVAILAYSHGLTAMAATEWSGNRSWASNLGLFTNVAAAFAGFVAAETPAVTTAGVLFALLALLAPMVYSLTLRSSDEKEGPVWGYLIASFLTLWSALGGLFTIWDLLDNLVKTLSGTGAESVGTFIGIMVILSIILVLFFAFRRLMQTIGILPQTAAQGQNQDAVIQNNIVPPTGVTPASFQPQGQRSLL